MHVNRSPVWVAILACVTISQAVTAGFYPHRIYQLRKKTSLNRGWKFYRNSPAGNPNESSYNDAAWETVNVPHSAMYVAPTPESEMTTVPDGNWTGISWYRKTFRIPQGDHTRRIFLEFEGAMQSAEVWVNGQNIGTHDACGYSGFSFDITDAVISDGDNVLAVKIDCNYRWEIPPGNVESQGSWPDYFLFSGLYRDVWLVCTDEVYIPLHGQRITTPRAAATGGTVRVRTTVHNSATAARTTTVKFMVVDEDNSILRSTSQTATVAPDASFTFDRTTDAITPVQLWSPEHPALYRVYTRVSTDENGVVDDFVERFGFRTIDWSPSGGFSLNGQRYLLRGVCMHQAFAWVGNAVPDSRYFEELKLAKDMGANAVRCSHYPRDPSFYNGCDELGLICQPELPSWGNFIQSYPDVFWDRMNIIAKEMVDVGYNHPSIIQWGMFNEPVADFSSQFTRLNNTLKALDSTRFTAIINNHVDQQQNTIPNLLGLNYNLSTPLSNRSIYNAEFHEGWIKWGYRGDTSTVNDGTLEGSLSENKFAEDRWSGNKNWTQIEAAANGSGLAGGFMWCFIDYWSPFMSHPMGVLDHYRIPKKAYYTFQEHWNQGVQSDYAATGLSATKIGLEADVTTLVADSTDLSRVIGSFRTGGNACVWSTEDITFEVEGPVDVFEGNPVTRQAVAGKIGIVLKSRNTPGTVTITARSGSLAAGTMTLQVVPPDTSALPFIWKTSAEMSRMVKRSANRVTFAQLPGRLRIVASGKDGPGSGIALVTIQGKRFDCPVTYDPSGAVVDTRNVVPGIYTLQYGGKNVATVLLVQ